MPPFFSASFMTSSFFVTSSSTPFHGSKRPCIKLTFRGKVPITARKVCIHLSILTVSESIVFQWNGQLLAAFRHFYRPVYRNGYRPSYVKLTNAPFKFVKFYTIKCVEMMKETNNKKYMYNDRASCQYVMYI